MRREGPRSAHEADLGRNSWHWKQQDRIALGTDGKVILGSETKLFNSKYETSIYLNQSSILIELIADFFQRFRIYLKVLTSSSLGWWEEVDENLVLTTVGALSSEGHAKYTNPPISNAADVATITGSEMFSVDIWVITNTLTERRSARTWYEVLQALRRLAKYRANSEAIILVSHGARTSSLSFLLRSFGWSCGKAQIYIDFVF